MELDCYFPDGVRLSEAATAARSVQDAGFAAMWVTETRHNPFLTCGVGLAAAERIRAGSGIAVAFPRSPMVTAQLAWDLAEASGGRFVLGLGSQVKAHIERRFSTAFDQPVPRLREYVRAVRAIFAAFQNGTGLRFAGDFYDFSLLTDFFNPGPIGHPDVPVWVAAVGPAMLRMAGECCDGVFLHPLHSADFLRATVLPAVTAGRRLGRAEPRPGHALLPGLRRRRRHRGGNPAAAGRHRPADRVLRVDPHVPSRLRHPRLGRCVRRTSSPDGPR